MFAHLKGTPFEFSVKDKLREIEVANENMHGSTDYTGKVSFFKCSAAYQKITTFLQRLNTAVQGQTVRQLCGETAASQPAGGRKVQIFAADAVAQQQEGAEDKQDTSAPTVVPTPASILALEQMLIEIESFVERCPPADKNIEVAEPTAPSSTATSPSTSTSLPVSSRFGSPAFREFLTLLTAEAPRLVDRVLDSVPQEARSQRWPDVDAEQSEQSKTWEAEGFETLKAFKAKHGAEGHQHHAVHKLPPGVVIQHGPHGIGNGPSLQGKKKEGEEKGEQQEQKEEEGDAPSASPTAASTDSTTSASVSKHDRLVQQLCRYLVQSWGDIRRLDYGTGHELNFLCFLYALSECSVFDPENDVHAQRIIGLIFSRYVRLMRRLQTTYWLEPAGSRGVWGLDDYCFLPFLFGSAQLMSHPHIKPKSVRYPEILDGFADDYLYLDAIRFILSVKTCSFAEHSPMLNDITIIKTWSQVNAGLWKMYQAEVLGKFAVVQHFIYSPMLQKWPVQPLQVTEVKEEAPCCGDAIHFPSSIGAKQTRVQPPKL